MENNKDTFFRDLVIATIVYLICGSLISGIAFHKYGNIDRMNSASSRIVRGIVWPIILIGIIFDSGAETVSNCLKPKAEIEK